MGTAVKYRPLSICSQPQKVDSAEHWIEAAQLQIEAAVAAKGATIGFAEVEDFEAVNALRKTIFGPLASAMGDFEVLRILRHGFVVVIRQEGVLIGLEMNCSYHNGSSRTDYALMIGVHPSQQGQGWGSYLNRYASLEACKRGGVYRRCVTAPSNVGSLSNLLNRTGYRTIGYHSALLQGNARLEFGLPLTQEALEHPADLEKVKAFMQAHEAEADFLLTNVEDHEVLQRAHEAQFSAVAYFKAGLINEHAQLFMLSPQHFQAA